MDIDNVLAALPKKKFCVIGDLIVDYYRILKEKRLSQEAPVVVFTPEAVEYRLGGAANVANNIHDMGSDVLLMSVTGDDLAFMQPMVQIPFCEQIIKVSSRQTTVKERLVTKRQQVARIDSPSGGHIEPDMATDLFRRWFLHGSTSDVMVISDYNHGVMTPWLCAQLQVDAKKLRIPVVVNSKAPDTLIKYFGVDMLIMNLQEARDITSEPSLPARDMAALVLDKSKAKSVAITMGPHGIMLAQETPDGNDVRPYPPPGVKDDEVIDVTGAGDTVTAFTAMGIALGMELPCIMKLANLAAGIVIKKRGVATTTPQEVRGAMGGQDATL